MDENNMISVTGTQFPCQIKREVQIRFTQEKEKRIDLNSQEVSLVFTSSQRKQN
jgi:hypothetical protein